MPPRKKGRTTKAKEKMVSLSEEDQKKRDQCDLLIKDFDKQCEMAIKDLWREKETVVNSIKTMYKLELMKLPQEVKVMNWNEYFNQFVPEKASLNPVGELVSEVLEDSICVAVDSKVDQLKSALTTTKKRGRKKADPENDAPPTVTRTSSRNRGRVVAPSLSEATNLETPANTRSTRAKTRATNLETPANSRAPPNLGKTPLITPKFDTANLSRTVSRTAKAGEVLVSLSGSPVVLDGRNKRGKKNTADMAAIIPLGGGATLNVPLGSDVCADHLDEEQTNRLEELKKSLEVMLKARKESEDN